MAGGSGGVGDVGILILRLAGLGLAYHGWQKVAGGQMDMLTDGVAKMGFPVPSLFAWAAAASELLGGTLVAAGLYTRVAATFAAVTMFVAAFLAHANDGFQVREPALLYLAAMLGLAFLGAGRWSADGMLRKGK